MTYLLLAAYNESKGLSAILEKLGGKQKALEPLKVVIVDDGSSDNTPETIRKFQESRLFAQIHTIRHAKNQGLGRALRTGFAYICPKLNPEDTVFTMDADNTHPVDMMPSMLEKIKSGADLVIASRFVRGSRIVGLPLHRWLLGYSASWYHRWVAGRWTPRDYTGGFRAYTAAFLAKAWRHYGENLIEQTGFAASAEILLKILYFKPKVEEVALTLRYDMKEGASKIKIFSAIGNHLRLGLILKAKGLLKTH